MKVTDVGLKQLAALKSLTVLDLWGTEVTGVGLAKELSGLSKPTDAESTRHKGNGCGAEGPGRTQELADIEFTRHAGDGCWIEGIGRV